MNREIEIVFWGVRGSIPTPGSQTVAFGGNTASVSIQIGNTWFVIDAGTGIRPLGEHIVEKSNQEVYLLLTHLHHDHIQGLPYFEPLYTNNTKIKLVKYNGGQAEWSPLAMFDGIHFPLTPDKIVADVSVLDEFPVDILERHGIHLSTISINHPGGGYGFRFDFGKYGFVHIPDNELMCTADFAPSTYKDFVDFCANATILSHDSHLREHDLPQKKGWGHSQIAELVQLAIDARVGHVVPFHHDPTRTDDLLEETQRKLREQLHSAGIQCTLAYEGLRFSFQINSP